MLAQEKADKIYLTGIILLVVSLPLSMFLMSVSQFVILGSWLLSGNVFQKLKKAFSDKLVLVATGIYFLHIIGLLWTNDFEYAIKDLRVKLPLLALPVIFSTSTKFTTAEFKLILKFFIAATLVSTFISIGVFFGITPKKINDIREISVFISHIRLSLLVCMAVFCSVYLWSTSLKIATNFVLLSVTIIWFLFFLSLLESFTGLGIIVFTGVIFHICNLIRQKKMIGLSISIFIISCVLFFAYSHILSVWKSVSMIKQSEKTNAIEKTGNGNPYMHSPERFETENGYLVYNNICEPELESEWNKRSTINFSHKDRKGNEIKYTLIRYLTSKGLKKDSAGLAQLNAADIHAVEKGVPNVNILNHIGINSRLHIIAWEINNYKKGGNPSGHSVTMRFEFWNASLFIIKKHIWKGAGTGDVPQSFRRVYSQLNSPLSEQWRLRAHNQFLTIAIALGLPALLFFIFSLIAPVIYSPNGRSFLFLAFLLTAILSMLTEDTLETQAGVTFFAVFNGLFIWGQTKNIEK